MYAKRNPVEYSSSGVFNSLMLVVTERHTYLNETEVLAQGLFKYV